jgi:hypothetical protein
MEQQFGAYIVQAFIMDIIQTSEGKHKLPLPSLCSSHPSMDHKLKEVIMCIRKLPKEHPP